MSEHYILDENKQAVKADLLEWAWFCVPSIGKREVIMRAQWRKELDWAEAEQRATIEFKRGDKVRLISDPEVVLHVREVDPYGKIDGTAKVLCFNSYGHGKWIRIGELEAV